MAASSQVRICLLIWLIGIASSLDLVSSANTAVTPDSNQLSPGFYNLKCPLALPTIKAAVIAAVLKERRMGASLLRLHFHDCFVQGCDASVLLKDTTTFKGEQSALPNVNSLRGYDVIDNIKAQLEKWCPGVVSCADIVATAARDSVVVLGGPAWDVRLGRRDSTTANLSAANSDLPSPFLDLSGLIAAFEKKNFSVDEMVALSGAHTIGQSRCSLFRSRIYSEQNIDPAYARSLQGQCPRTSGVGDSNLSPIDTTPNFFDSTYYRNLMNKKGLFHSDQQLFNGGSTDSKVSQYASNPLLFRIDFANAMVKMGNLGTLTGTQGQIRKVCSSVN
ncbi:cationic peroxidase 1-like [Lotus japonicus]|uniref:cationic peroxidase 1-like n=1 Tax=Lotus japonicus TaxID=34305 RepID=UPI002583EA64|nr:cationic peroxidase 1-like [Lotus japonicus]